MNTCTAHRPSRWSGILLLLCSAAAPVLAENVPAAHWALAPTPPMGWNSYDAFGSSVTEAEVMANANYIKEKLFSHGWNYVVIDYRWSDADAAKHDLNGNGGPLTMDAFGRLIPAPNRFPSAADGKGLKPIADQVHALGLKFGIHIMRGIPRQAVASNLPIEHSPFKAADAANTKSTCSWCRDMWGVNAKSQAGQDYYDSIFRLYASWDVDFVKVDDLSNPYSGAEIEAIRKAIDKSGRPMVFSTSPGETPVKEAAHISAHANMWRISGDFWDKWGSLNHNFDLAAAWAGLGGPGRWPDADMIPFGHLAIRSVGKDRRTGFTKDEQITLMSLWCLMPAPLMLGGNLPDNDAWDFALLVNDEVLAVDQDPLGLPAQRIVQQNSIDPNASQPTEIWAKRLKDGSYAIGFFNRGATETTIRFRWAEAGLPQNEQIRDLWKHKDLNAADQMLALPVPAHGAALLRFSERNAPSNGR